ncbi:molybdenum cofactor synthesis domain-containing protein [Eilatimonas milleporae]|uniref:Molybdenum cofactor synthesis domain-containing protein n=2 Tax=Eilatimonas milleporae TaxID=911205 RepID=A0A3M0C564_9PROT|nr:molybdopterin-binding protein [Eilatimonas milleporae]RMB04868.1 molybdenum cofactor synthesis domain-containing protein [Eilatimonas milleporae]
MTGMDETAPVTAALLIIGDEILSGRTQDKNLAYLAAWLNEAGIDMAEARVVPDVEAVVVEAVRALRGRYTYVFTTGGIGPTHDDITAECLAKAFEVPLQVHPEAHARLLAHYGEADFTPARQRMARVPEGAVLIDNPVSIAPGFQIGNVFVMAGVPKIMQAMLEGLRARLKGGVTVLSKAVTIRAPESAIAGDLGEIQAAHTGVSIGSYPFFRDATGQSGAQIVVRSRDAAALEAACAAVIAYCRRENLPFEEN